MFKIIDKPDILITSKDYQKYLNEYQKYASYCVDPMPFEEYVKMKKNGEKQQTIDMSVLNSLKIT